MSESIPLRDEPVPRRQHSYRGLIAILIGIVLGILVGVFYGRTMWIASGGPERELERLEQASEQKADLASDALREAEEARQQGDVERAQALERRGERLGEQLPLIRAEMRRLSDLATRHQQRLDGGEGARPFDARYARANAIAVFFWEIIRFLGDIFLQVLKLLVIPLVVTSMICGIASLGDIRRVGRVGAWTIFYYLSTSAIAVLLGILLVQVVQPGVAADDTYSYIPESLAAKENTTPLSTLLAVFRGTEGDPGSGMFPSNIFLAASQTNVLALIIFALVFGGALTTLGSRATAAIDFFSAANEAVMKMVHLVMYFAPIGIFGLVATNIAKNGGGQAFVTEMQRIGWYVGTVLLGLLIHSVFLAAILAFLARRNPLTYTLNLMRALLTAISTSSSSATLPVTMECVEGNNGVSNRAASFVLPLGATINMDGTALYEAVAVVFIAQTLGLDLSGGQLLVVFLTATLAAIGAAGIPEAGLVTMVMVLTAVGLPVSGIGTILAIDWFLDRARTTVNIYGDAIGAAVIDRIVIARGG